MSELKQPSFLREQYTQLVKRYEPFFDSDSIDFIGINIDEHGVCRFKLYLKPSICREDRHPWIESFRQQGMLRTLTRIERPEMDAIQYDIGLANRTVDNMQSVFNMLKETDFLGAQEIRETEILASMKTCAAPEMKFAALYFLGIQEIKGTLEQVKLHFLTRVCDQSDQIGKNYYYDDAYYLGYLQECLNREFQSIIAPACELLDKANGHLWMIGLDFARNGQQKRKIYIKSKHSDLMNEVGRVLADRVQTKSQLYVGVNEVAQFLRRESIAQDAGCAFCVDAKGTWTVNYYGKPR